jgi:basic membrane protein A
MKNLFIVTVLLISLSISACKKSQEVSQSPTDKSKFKVGLVFDVGGRGDKSFNDAAYKRIRESQEGFRH